MEQDYINQTLNSQTKRLNELTYRNNHELKTRSMFISIDKLIKEFTITSNSVRWISITGLRGIGKSILLAQLAKKWQGNKFYTIHLQVDLLNTRTNLHIIDYINAYLYRKEDTLHNLKKPLLLFLDEVQEEKGWQKTLKTLHDLSSNIIIICTGSSMLEFGYGANEVGRMQKEQLLPLSFVDFSLLKNSIYPKEGISSFVSNLLLDSPNVEYIQQQLQLKQISIESYYRNFSNLDLEVNSYLRWGTITRTLQFSNERRIIDNINDTIERVITEDIGKVLKEELLLQCRNVLYLLTDTDLCALAKIEKALSIKKKDLTLVLECLEKSGLISEVPIKGSNKSQISKSKKYLFSCPAIRNAISQYPIGGKPSKDSESGMWEDIVFLYLYKQYKLKKDFHIFAPSSKAPSSDFIIQNKDRSIAIEVSSGTKDYNQIESSIEEFKCDYGIIIHKGKDIEINPSHTAIKIPLEILFLIA